MFYKVVVFIRFLSLIYVTAYTMFIDDETLQAMKQY